MEQTVSAQSKPITHIYFQNASSIDLFPQVVSLSCDLAMKNLAKQTAILVPIAVPCIWR